MDPEKTLTFCLGLQAQEITMSLQELVTNEGSTVSVTDNYSVTEIDMSTIDKQVVKHQSVISPKFCPGVNNKAGYLCETGHCCGETSCCTYYYELWWFWMLWMLLILFSCFCAYRHRRAKLRLQQQQRQREINLIAYNGACNNPSSMLDLTFLTSFNLPTYDEVAAQPSSPPPPYSSIFALQGVPTAGPSSPYPHRDQHQPCPPYLDSGPGPSTVGPSSSYPHHHHHRQPCPTYLSLGPSPGPGPSPSALTSSQSSTSCSCESCSLTSPSSTSFSVQVTDETYNSSRLSTPSEAGGNFDVTPRSWPPSSQILPDLIPAVAPDVISVQRCCSNGSEGVSSTRPPLSLPVHSHAANPSRLPLSPLNLLSSHPSSQIHPLDLLSSASIQKANTESSPQDKTPSPCSQPKRATDEEDEEDDDEEDHFRHRRLTGDSGIEVCRCHVRRRGEEQQKGHLEKGKKEEGGGRANTVHTTKRAVWSRSSDDCEEQRGGVPPSSSVAHRAGDTVITLESS